MSKRSTVINTCACGGTPHYVMEEGYHVYAQLVCPACGAKGIKQAGDSVSSARWFARSCWNRGEREAAHV